jgi:V/A-type H+-transporting ATPase subunit C
MSLRSLHYAVARIKVLETKLLNMERLNRMIESESADGAFKALLDSGYGISSGVQDPKDFEHMISNELDAMRELIMSITPDERLTGVFLLHYDYQNAKAFLKMRMSSRDVPDAVSGAGTIDINELKEMVYQHDTVGLPDHLAQAMAQAEKQIEAEPDPRVVDMIMDRAYMDWAYHTVSESGDQYLMDYITARIDMQNIMSFLRVRSTGAGIRVLKNALFENGSIDIDFIMETLPVSNELLPGKFSETRYGKTLQSAIDSAISSGRTWAFEKLTDNYLMNMARQMKDEVFTIAPLIGYIIAKENEAQAVRMVMTAKLNDISQEAIRERLREIYV